MFNKNRYRFKILSKVKYYAVGVKRFFFLNAFLSLIVMLLNFLTPVVYKLFIDDVIIQKKIENLLIVIVGYLLIFTVNTLIGYAKKYSTNRLVNRVIFKVKFNIWNEYFKRHFTFYEKQSIGDMKMRLDDDVVYLSQFANVQTIDYIISYITMVVALILLFIIEWHLALFALFAIPLTFYVDHLVSKREKVLNEENRENQQKMSTWLHNTVQGWREVRALNLEKHEQIRYVRFLHLYALYFGKWINYWVIRVLVLPRIKEEFFMKFTLYFIGGLLIINEHLTIGVLLLFVKYYELLSKSVQNLSKTDAELQNSMHMSDRLLEELDRVSRQSDKKSLPKHETNRIIFNDVAFSYSEDKKNVLKNISFEITSGERVAIIGKSGCGKTTILKLMVGMLRPTSGNVSFSNVDMFEINEKYLYGKIGFVMQENMLFNMSLRDNLSFGRRHITDDELEVACKKACIYDLILDAPNGYDTIIGEKGLKLSGGQRQRIILARLFLRDVDVFIFDEATSALDQYSESIIQDTISNIEKRKTIIVVAHRQSSISICNRILHIEEGELKEERVI